MQHGMPKDFTKTAIYKFPEQQLNAQVAALTQAAVKSQSAG